MRDRPARQSGHRRFEYLNGGYKSGRAIGGPLEQGDELGNWSPPLDLAIDTAHGRHLYVNGRRTWSSQGGYPTLTRGGLRILEVAVPFGYHADGPAPRFL